METPRILYGLDLGPYTYVPDGQFGLHVHLLVMGMGAVPDKDCLVGFSITSPWWGSLARPLWLEDTLSYDGT